jgi:SAM-dependent methyltransferase
MASVTAPLNGSEEIDAMLQDLGFFPHTDIKEFDRIARKRIGGKAMGKLIDYFTCKYENSQEYLLNKCAEDGFFEVIHSTKYDLFKTELLWLKDILPRDALIADIGCNTGHITSILARLMPESRFVGYDLIDSAIVRAERIKEQYQIPKLSFECRDAFSISIDPKPDGILSLQAIGPTLTSKERVDWLCNLLDEQAFIVLVDNFYPDDEEMVRKMLVDFQQNGFQLFEYELLTYKSIYGKGSRPALFLTRGIADVPEIDSLLVRMGSKGE